MGIGVEFFGRPDLEWVESRAQTPPQRSINLFLKSVSLSPRPALGVIVQFFEVLEMSLYVFIAFCRERVS